jgi:integrase
MTTGSRSSLGTYKCSLGTYTHSGPTQQGNDEILERSFGETRRSSVQIRPAPPNINNLLPQLERNGASKSVITNTRKYLTLLEKHADLDQPEQVKDHIAHMKTKQDQPATDAYKRIITYAYKRYVDYNKIEWTRPKYSAKSKPIHIPTTIQVNSLISGAKQPLSMKLRISAKTGLRPIEVYSLHVKDVDLERQAVSPTTAKGGNPRTIKHADNILNEQLRYYIIKNDLQPNDLLFKGSEDDYCKHYRAYRNRLAKKLNDPNLTTIRLYDMRHYFATITYYKYKDIPLLGYLMGHKNLATTMKYMHVLNVDDDGWTVRHTQTLEESEKLLEAGFDYITDQDGYKIFRKRK